MSKKLCPMRKVYERTQHGCATMVNSAFQSCLKEKCAWFITTELGDVEVHGYCAILDIARKP
jgi:hypothetical protein